MARVCVLSILAAAFLFKCIVSISIRELFNFDLEPLIDNETLISAYATRLQADGYFKIDGVLSNEAVQLLSRQVSTSSISRVNVFRNAWQNPHLDSSFASDHPMNHMALAKGGFIGRSDVPQTLIDVYNYPPVLQLFRRITMLNNYQSPYLSSDAEGSVYGLVGTQGDIGGPHLDQHPFSCVWMLQRPLYDSGIFKFVRFAPLKHESAEHGTQFEWDFDLMRRLNAQDENVLAEHQKTIPDVRNGDIYCFEGNITLHETTPIVGEINRIVFVTAFHEIPNFEHTSNVNDNNQWGTHKQPRDVGLAHSEL